MGAVVAAEEEGSEPGEMFEVRHYICWQTRLRSPMFEGFRKGSPVMMRRSETGSLGHSLRERRTCRKRTKLSLSSSSRLKVRAGNGPSAF